MISKDISSNGLTQEIGFIAEASSKTAKDFFNDFESYYNYQDELSQEINNHLVDGEIWRLSVIAPYLYQKFDKNLDFLMVYLYETDYISHIFWKFMKPEVFKHKAWGLNIGNIKKFGNVIEDMYIMTDKFVKKLIKDIADENTIIIICSDHGFQSSSYRQQDGTVVPIILFKNLDKLLEKMGFLQFRSNVKSGKSGESEKISIDFTKTQPYHYQLDEPNSYANLFISINLKGREANGIVEPGEEYTKVKKA